MNIGRRFKSYFLRGLAVLLPTMLTLWILAKAYVFVQENVSVHINRGVVEALVWFHAREGISDKALKEYRGSLNERFVTKLSGSIVGLLIAMAVVVLVGALLASVVGRALWRIVEAFIMSTPVLRRVFPYVKQVTDFLLTEEEQKKMFSRVVAVEYPRKGIWSVGFVTGSGLQRIAENVHEECLTILVPNSPTPITGYVIVVPKAQTIALEMTVEEAFRFAISAGVITPERKRPAALSGADMKPWRQPQQQEP